MNASKIIGILALAAVLLCLFTCQNREDEDGQSQDKLRVRYLAEEVCCGNMEILDDIKIARICDLPDDNLLKGVNLFDFAIAQNLQDGDILMIKYKLTEDCQAFCEVICNRWHAIPVEITSVE